MVKVKRKNKINTEDTPADALSSGHPQVDLSATLGEPQLPKILNPNSAEHIWHPGLNIVSP